MREALADRLSGSGAQSCGRERPARSGADSRAAGRGRLPARRWWLGLLGAVDVASTTPAADVEVEAGGALIRERTVAGLAGRAGSRPEGRQEVRAVESAGEAGPVRDGARRHVGVRAAPRAPHQAGDALPVRRPAGPVAGRRAHLHVPLHLLGHAVAFLRRERLLDQLSPRPESRHRDRPSAAAVYRLHCPINATTDASRPPAS